MDEKYIEVVLIYESILKRMSREEALDLIKEEIKDARHADMYQIQVLPVPKEGDENEETGS